MGRTGNGKGRKEKAGPAGPARAAHGSMGLTSLEKRIFLH